MRSPVTFKTDAQHRAAVLRVMCLALVMVVAAVASLNVALPEIARDTGASQTRAAVDRRRLRDRVRRPPPAGGRDRRPLSGGSRC